MTHTRLTQPVSIPRWTYRLGHSGTAGSIGFLLSLVFGWAASVALVVACAGYIAGKEGWDLWQHYRHRDDRTVTWRDFAADSTDVLVWVPLWWLTVNPGVGLMALLLWGAAAWLTMPWSRP